MVFIYILELENKKYYVGKTTNPKFRLNQHFNSSGSQWTKKYKPIKILELIPNCDDYDEDKYTLQYMKSYGINNVRGGSFCELKLNNSNSETISKMINGASDNCFICGKNGHFAKECHNDNDNFYKSLEKILCDNDLCFRCFRKGHYESSCYAKKSIIGQTIDNSTEEDIDNSTEEIDNSTEEIDNSTEEEIDIFYCSYCNKEFKSLKGVTCHQNLYCKQKTSICQEIYEETYSCSYCDKEFETLKGVTCHENLYCKQKKSCNKKVSSKQQNICYRCGREGHFSTDCYASKHKNGKYLS